MASSEITKVDVPPLELRQPTLRDGDADRALRLVVSIAAAVAGRRSDSPFVPPSEFEEGAPRALLSV
jgi:hypothetical protein